MTPMEAVLQDGKGLQSAIVQFGRRIVVGDKVTVIRAGWIGRIGTYIGKDYRKGKLKIQFTEFGGTLLLCYAQELRRIPDDAD
jgi:transcription antitermination factor NusG